MSILIKNMEMPKGCIYANDNDQTEYCPLLNHDDVPFCQYIESEPEIAIGIGERPVYCPLSDVPEPCENTVSRQAAIDAVMQYCPDDDGSCSKADRDIRELLDDIEKQDLPNGCTDTISRAAAIDALNGLTEIYLNNLPPTIYKSDAVDAITALPPAQPGWIPCSERLPEAEYPAIVTWKNDDPASYYQYILGKHYTGVAHYKNGKWYWYSSVTEDVLMEYGRYESEEFDEAIKVLAWMPLPNPYRPEGEEHG